MTDAPKLKPTLDRDDVLLLNRRAKNVTRLHFEDGIDFDLWRFMPARDGRPGEFSDGHSQAHAAPSQGPYEGWVLDEDEVPLSVGRVLDLLALLEGIERGLDKLVEPKKAADRRAAAWYVRDAVHKARKCLSGHEEP